MPSVLSTKKLLPNQRELLLNAGLSFVEYDAITIEPIEFTLPENLKNVIITSQHGAKAFLNSNTNSNTIENYFVVGEKTTALLTENGKKVTKTAQNSQELARFISKNYKKEHFTYFCGNLRREELPAILKNMDVALKEIIVYETTLNEQSFNQGFDGVFLYSPSGVEAFAKANTFKNTTAFCIGETTAAEARKHTDTIIVSNATTIESTIAKAVKHLK